MVDIACQGEDEQNNFLETDKDGKPNYGKLIRQRREEIGWTRQQFAVEYGTAVRDKEVGVKAIEMMEDYNQVPKNPKRRYVLATLLGISPVLLGLPPLLRVGRPLEDAGVLSLFKSQSVNVEEYTTALGIYWKKGASARGDVVGDIMGRISCLHDNVLYVSSPEKDKMARLLCGYDLIVAKIAQELLLLDIASDYQNKAIVLAREKGYHDLHGFALFRRGADSLDQKDFTMAMDSFTAALSLKKYIPGQLTGSILTVAGKAQAGIAQNRMEVSEALADIERAENMIGRGIEVAQCVVKFDHERYALNKAATFVASPVKELHLPDNALEALAEIAPNRNAIRRYGYRQIYNNIIQAKAYIDKSVNPKIKLVESV